MNENSLLINSKNGDNNYMNIHDNNDNNDVEVIESNQLMQRKYRASSYPPVERLPLPGVICSTAEDISSVLADEFDHSSGFLPKGTLASAVFSLSSISLGVGVFVLPGVFKTLGIISALFLLIIMGLWSYICQIWLIKAAKVVNANSYEQLAEHAFGKAGRAGLAFFTAFTLFVGNSGHIKAVVQLLHDLMEWYVTGEYGNIPFPQSKKIILYVGLLSCALPFCARKTISSLRYMSTASVTVVLFLCIWCSMECFFWFWPKHEYAFTGSKRAQLTSLDWSNYASNIPAIAFAYTGTFALFPVNNELNDKSQITSSIAISTALCTSGYAFVSLIGILTFGTTIGNDPTTGSDASNYLYVFKPDHYVITFGCFVLIIVITLLYPVINFPMLNAIEKLLEMSSLEYFQYFLNWRHHRLFLSLIGMIGVVFLNFQFKSLVTVFGFCGGWGVGTVSYIIPSLIYLRICKTASAFSKFLAVISTLAMVIVIIGFTYVTFFKKS